MPDEARINLLEKLNWKYFFVGFVVLTLAGLSFAGRSYLAIMKQGGNVSFGDFALSYLVDFYLWGLLSPVIFYFCHRFPVGRERKFSRIVLFLWLGVALSLIVAAVSAPVYWFLATPPDPIRYPSLTIYYEKIVLFLVDSVADNVQRSAGRGAKQSSKNNYQRRLNY